MCLHRVPFHVAFSLPSFPRSLFKCPPASSALAARLPTPLAVNNPQGFVQARETRLQKMLFHREVVAALEASGQKQPVPLPAELKPVEGRGDLFVYQSPSCTPLWFRHPPAAAGAMQADDGSFDWEWSPDLRVWIDLDTIRVPSGIWEGQEPAMSNQACLLSSVPSHKPLLPLLPPSPVFLPLGAATLSSLFRTQTPKATPRVSRLASSPLFLALFFHSVPDTLLPVTYHAPLVLASPPAAATCPVSHYSPCWHVQPSSDSPPQVFLQRLKTIREIAGKSGTAAASCPAPLSLPPIPLDADVPPEFLCPISHDVMTDPVVSPSGVTYERSCICRWLENNSFEPATNRRLRPGSLYPNLALRHQIEAWASVLHIQGEISSWDPALLDTS